ncbi:MAG: hypothetical protein ACKO4A_09080, partial [Gammaproteobacteria bacterium]
SVRGAYNVLVNLMVLATMLPFLALFASAIRLSGEPAEPGETRIPGGKYTVRAMATLGLLTTSAAMVLALVPAADEANPLLAVGKVGGTTVVLVAIGLLIYRSGVRRAAAAGRTAETRTSAPRGPLHVLSGSSRSR